MFILCFLFIVFKKFRLHITRISFFCRLLHSRFGCFRSPSNSEKMWNLWQTILLFEDTENSEKFCRQPQHDVKNSELPGGFSKGFELIQIVLPVFPTLVSLLLSGFDPLGARESQNFRFDKFVTIWRFKLKINDLY